jgi:hypothetical protein
VVAGLEHCLVEQILHTSLLHRALVTWQFDDFKFAIGQNQPVLAE